MPASFPRQRTARWSRLLIANTSDIYRVSNYYALKQRSYSDLELVAGEAVERNVAVLFGEDIGKPRGEAVIVETPVEQGDG
jgi:hypothetical protein